MFHSFPVFEQEMENTWRHEEDPLTQLMKKIDHMERQMDVFDIKRKMSRLESQLDNLKNMRRDEFEDTWRQRPTTVCDPHHAFADRINLDKDTNTGFSNNSYFSLNNHGLVSQPYHTSTFFSETFDSYSSQQMSPLDEKYENFKLNQTKVNEEIFESLKSLSSKLDNVITQRKMLETKIAQQEYFSYGPHNEQHDRETLQSDREFESFSSKKIETWYETDDDDSIQIEIREEQNEIEKAKSEIPPYMPPIPFPQRLFYNEINKSNELEMKHPPIGTIIDEPKEEEDGDTTHEVDASDKMNEKFTKVDLSNQLRKCLKKFDVMEGNKPQIKYHILIEPCKKKSKQEHNKHVSRDLLNHFWENYDALRGRKVKIR